MIPQGIIEVKTLESEIVRIRVYARGIVVERGGETCAFLAGVRVPDWLVEKSPTEIDPRELFRLKSPELISRFISKAGPRRVMSMLKGNIVDREARNRLIVFDDEGRTRSYIMGWHYADPWALEEVDPSIRTVSEAWAWQRLKEERRKRRDSQWRGIRY